MLYGVNNDSAKSVCAQAVVFSFYSKDDHSLMAGFFRRAAMLGQLGFG